MKENAAVNRIRKSINGPFWAGYMDSVLTPLIETNFATVNAGLQTLIDGPHWRRAAYWIALSGDEEASNSLTQHISSKLLLAGGNYTRRATHALAIVNSAESLATLLEAGYAAVETNNIVCLADILDGLLYSDHPATAEFLGAVFHAFVNREVNKSGFYAKLEAEVVTDAAMCLSRFDDSVALDYARRCIAGECGEDAREIAIGNLGIAFCGHPMFATELCRAVVADKNDKGWLFHHFLKYAFDAIPLDPVPPRCVNKEVTIETMVAELRDSCESIDKTKRLLALLTLGMLVGVKPTAELTDMLKGDEYWSRLAVRVCAFGKVDVADDPKPYLEAAADASDPLLATLIRARLNEPTGLTECRERLVSLLAKREHLFDTWVEDGAPFAPLDKTTGVFQNRGWLVSG